MINILYYNKWDGLLFFCFYFLLLAFSLTEMKNTQANSHFIPLLFILIYLLVVE